MAEDIRYFPQGTNRDLDVLFVVSTARSMLTIQHLAEQLPRLIDGLQSQRFGGAGCPATEPDCQFPNLHIGIINADLGAGSYDIPGCREGGDGGKLESKPRIPGCVPPTDPWISFDDGHTNIPEVASDPIAQMKAAFSCIGQLGVNGCPFQQPLEAARRALDPGRDLNPGFLRKDASLAIVFITNEDDCSAAKSDLFDPSQQGIDSSLGPLSSFRCFEFGINCDQHGRQPGTRTGCAPGLDWLNKVEDYSEFFKGLKPPGRAMLFAITGPTEPVEVAAEDSLPVLAPSCHSDGSGRPAIRLKSTLAAYGDGGRFNEGVDSNQQRLEVNICSPDFGRALAILGQRIVDTLCSQCMGGAPVTPSCGLACTRGDIIAMNSDGTPARCDASCLDQADCSVQEVTGLGTSEAASVNVPKCTGQAFADSNGQGCGATCPCWRLRPASSCNPERDGSPYGFEILRQKRAAKGAVAVVHCQVSPYPWGSEALASTGQCL